MSALSVNPPYPIFSDADGSPLDDGYIWIGVSNLSPQSNPITVYWNAELTQVAYQPIRTLAGYPANSGTPARLYVNSDYSIRVMNKNGSVVYSAPFATERYSDVVVSGVNAEDVIYDPPFLGGVQTNVEEKLSQTISVKDFGALGNGTANDTSAFDAAVASFGTTGGILYFPPGEYLGKLTINQSNITVFGYGAKLKSNADSEVILIQDPGSIPGRVNIFGFEIDGNNNATIGVKLVRAVDCAVRDLKITRCESHGVQITGDGIGASTHIEVSNCRINGPAGVDPTAAGISIGGGGVNAATRLFNNYIADYPTSIFDAGVNTVDVGGVFETGVNAVITTGGDGVFIGDWVETGSFSGAHFRIGDTRTTIIGTHGSTIDDVNSYAPGQFPARNNKILMQGASVIGNVVTPDGGVQYYSGSIGGSITANAPQNLRGIAQISGANTSTTVTFVNVEPDTSYYIVATPVSTTGSPAAGSNRVTSISKSTTGFTINVEAAPVGVATVTFDWVMVR